MPRLRLEDVFAVVHIADRQHAAVTLVSSSVMAPALSPLMVAVSLRPLMVMVTVSVAVPSADVTSKLSVSSVAVVHRLQVGRTRVAPVSGRVDAEGAVAARRAGLRLEDVFAVVHIADRQHAAVTCIILGHGPALSPLMVAVSLRPLMVMVTISVAVPSAEVTVKLSVS